MNRLNPWLIGALLFLSPAGLSSAGLQAADENGERPVVVVLRKPPRTEHSEQRLLVREVVRQAFLLTARETFRVATRDEVLGEKLSDAGLAPRVFDLKIDVPDDGDVTVELSSALSRGPAQTWKGTFRGKDEQMLVEAVRVAGGWIDADFPKFLRETGLAAARPAAIRTSDRPKPDPALEIIGQVAHLRRLHAALRQEPESAGRLAAVARHYAWLGSICEYHWGPEHKIFKARALLYGDLAVRRGDRDAGAAWSRAPVRYVCGLDFLVGPEVERARKLGDQTAVPDWADSLEAASHWEMPQLREKVDIDRPVTAYLAMLATEMAGSELQRIAAYREMLEADPNCLRAALAGSQEQPLGVRRLFGESQLPLFASNLPRMVSELYADGVKRLPARALPVQPRAEQIYAMSAAEISALRSVTGDTAEPSLSAAARLIENLQFAQATRLLETERGVLGVNPAETIQLCEVLLPEHPLRPLLRAYQQDVGGAADALRAMLAQGVSVQTETGYRAMRWLRWLRVEGHNELERAFRGVRDDISRDLACALFDGVSVDDRRRALRVLQRVSPLCPSVMIGTIELDWNSAAPLVEEWERGTDNPSVLRALSEQYRMLERLADEERCLKHLIEVDPSHNSFGALADFYWRQEREDRWNEVLVESLRLPSSGLEGAKISERLARWHMTRGEWQEAEPFALAAAQSYSAWGLRCGADCTEALGKWEMSEALISADARRYDGSWVTWYLWCRRTGLGDLEAARAIGVETVGRPESDDDSQDFDRATFYELEGNRKEALRIYLNRYRKFHEAHAAMSAVLLMGDLQLDAERDRLILEICSETQNPSPIVLLCDQLRRPPESPAPGLTAAELELTAAFDFSEGTLTSVAYYIGRVLQQQGRWADAEPWLRRAAGSPYRHMYACTLASAELIQAGEARQPVTAFEIDPAHRDSLRLLRGGPKFRRARDNEGLEKQFLSAVDGTPDWPVAWYHAARASVSNQHIPKSVESIDQLLKMIPGQPLILCYRAKLREVQHEYSAAAADYEAALASSPEFRIAHNNLGWLLACAPDDKLRDGKRALNHARKAIESSPVEDADGLDLLAAAYAELGQFPEAIKAAEAAISKGRTNDLSLMKRRLKSYQNGQPARRLVGLPAGTSYFSRY